jgi:hypothetical protein
MVIVTKEAQPQTDEQIQLPSSPTPFDTETKDRTKKLLFFQFF